MDNTNHRLPTGLELDGITNKSFDGDWVSEKRDDRRKSLSHFFRLIHGLTFISYIMLSIYLYIYIRRNIQDYFMELFASKKHHFVDFRCSLHFFVAAIFCVAGAPEARCISSLLRLRGRSHGKQPQMVGFCLEMFGK